MGNKIFNNFNLTDEEVLHIINKYMPLINKHSFISNIFDEDLKQEIIIQIYTTLTRNRNK